MALINQMNAKTGRLVKEDSTIVNQADYLGIVKAYYEDTKGNDHVVDGTGFVLANDASETILVTAGTLAMKVKHGEQLDIDVAAFTQLTVDPTTSLGTAQIETATLVAGNVTEAGDMAVIITAANMEHSPKTLLVPVGLADVTPTLIMAKVREAVAADEDVTAMFTVGGATTAMTLTGIRGRANDATLNVDLGGTGTTATGITRAGTSADTEAGVAPTAIAYRLWVRG